MKFFSNTGFVSRVIFTLAALAPIGIIGLNGRLLADEYCGCLQLLNAGYSPWKSAELYFANWAGDFFANLSQAGLSILPTLLVGKSFASAMNLILFTCAIWFFLYRLLRFSDAAVPREPFFASGSIAMSLTLSLLLAGAFPVIGSVEFVTQQAFIAHLILRYSGLLAVATTFLFVLSVAIWILGSNPRSAPKRLTRLGSLALLGLMAGLSYYLYAAMFLVTLAVISIRGPSRVLIQRELVLPNLVAGIGATLGVVLSLLSPGAEIRRTAIGVATEDRELINWAFAALGDASWTIATLATASSLVMFSTGFILGSYHRGLTETLSNLVGRRGLIKVGLFFAVMLLLQVVAGLNSYSAAWHILLPRTFVLLAIAALGFAVGVSVTSRQSRAYPSGPKSMIPILLTLALILPSAGWASQIPQDWENGHLPLQKISQGIGSQIRLADTDDPLWRSCYVQIAHLLREKKKVRGSNLEITDVGSPHYVKSRLEERNTNG